MDLLSLVLTSSLVLVPVIISFNQKLGLGKDILISVVRAVVQLVVIGYVLQFIFGLESPFFTSLLVLCMIINASLNTKKRKGNIKHFFIISFVAIFVGTIITFAVLILSKAISFTPSNVIPVGGMIVSNSMIAVGLCYQNINNAFKNRKDEILVKLSLGADIKDASSEVIKESIKMGIVPTLDSAKTLGIVSLPGMMTGLILAGQSPLTAIKFQIMVTFMIISASSIASVLCIYLSYRTFFNERKQLFV